jgi:hypothetical protein
VRKIGTDGLYTVRSRLRPGTLTSQSQSNRNKEGHCANLKSYIQPLWGGYTTQNSFLGILSAKVTQFPGFLLSTKTRI